MTTTKLDLKPGDWVRLWAYGGQIITRRVVELTRRKVYICQDDEYRAAQREGREPAAIGFPISDIVGNEP